MLPKEKNLEESIEDYLVSIGYEQGISHEFDLQHCLLKDDLFRFLEATQNELIEEFKGTRGAGYKKAFLDLVDSHIKKRGLIDVLRNGITDIMMNGKFEFVYFKPNSNLNKTAIDKYNENIFKITRQFKYSTKNNNTLDVVLSINGFPVIVIELKINLQIKMCMMQ